MKAYYEDSNVTLYHGNCLEIMPKLQLGMFDAVITDPPYGTTQNKWDSVIPLEPMWANLHNVCKDDGAIVLFAQNRFTFRLGLSNERNYRYSLVWEKTKAGGFLNARRMPMQAHEDILLFYKKLPTYNPVFTEGKPYVKTAVTDGDGKNYGRFDRAGTTKTNDGYRFPRSVIKFSNDNHGSQHPTQKPVELMEYLVKTYTNEGDFVLDFSCGSGTTGVAAKNLNRRCVMIELEEKYCEIAANRLIAADNRTPDLGL